MSPSSLVIPVPDTVERWDITRWQDSPPLAEILAYIHDTHATGRILLHVKDGKVLVTEFCERTTLPSPIPSPIPIPSQP